MSDNSHLDKKYFIDKEVYNCPYCNRRNVKYTMQWHIYFNWTLEKLCFVYFVNCSSCQGTSMHLSFQGIHAKSGANFFQSDIDIDSHIFYSVPTSFFVIDQRVPKVIRELVTEAEGCVKMNFLTGASACTRKAIYEMLILEKFETGNYDDRIKALKTKYKDTDPSLFDILAHIKDMTSDKVHEQSWDEWNSPMLILIIETLKTVLYDIYVIPDIRAQRSKEVMQLREKAFGKSSISKEGELKPGSEIKK